MRPGSTRSERSQLNAMPVDPRPLDRLLPAHRSFLTGLRSFGRASTWRRMLSWRGHLAVSITCLSLDFLKCQSQVADLPAISSTCHTHLLFCAGHVCVVSLRVHVTLAAWTPPESVCWYLGTQLNLDISSLLGPIFFTWLVQQLLPLMLVTLVYEKQQGCGCPIMCPTLPEARRRHFHIFPVAT